jgi:hypothetical protein
MNTNTNTTSRTFWTIWNVDNIAGEVSATSAADAVAIAVVLGWGAEEQLEAVFRGIE